MINTVPNIFRDDETLDPARLAENFEALARNLKDVALKRYTHSMVRRQFPALDQADLAGARQFRFTPPWGVEIVAVEMHAWGDDGKVVTLTADSGVTGFVDRTLTMKSDTTRASFEGAVAAPASARIAAGDTAVFSWSIPDATWNVERLDLILHVRADQHAAGLPEFVPPAITAGDTDDPSTMNTAFTDWATQYGLESSRVEQRRIEVIELPASSGGAVPTNDAVHRIPQCGGTLERVQYWRMPTTSTRTMNLEVRDETPTVLDTLVEGGSTSVPTSDEYTANDSQEDAPLNTAKDWSLNYATAGGTGDSPESYAVLFYS